MKKITKQGVYKGLSYAEYDSIPALRSTYLKKHLMCPAATQCPDEETDALRFGIAADCFILEGKEEFDKRYIVIQKYDGDKRKAEWKDIKRAAEQLASVTGKLLIDHEDYEAITIMDHNIRIHPTAKLFIGKQKPKMVVVWKDKATGFLLKAQFDVEPYMEVSGMEVRVIPDLKTTVDTSEYGFRKQIEKYHYDLSAAMYLQGASAALKEKVDIFLLIAPEKRFPHRVHVHELSADYIEQGSVKLHEALKKEKECREKGFYEPYLVGGVIVQEPYKKSYVSM